MINRKLVLGFFLSTLLALPVLPESLSGQGLWDMPAYEKSVGLEFAKPVFEDSDLSVLSSGIFLSVAWPLSDRFRFVGEIPMAYASWDGEDHGETGVVIGNPYLGLSLGKESSNLTGQVGLRLPLAPPDKDGSRIVGIFSNYVSHGGADFWGDLVPITGTLTYKNRGENGFVLLATGGADAWIFTEGGGDGSELFGLYGARVGYDGPTWMVLGGFGGRAILTEDTSLFDDGSVHELGVEAGYRTTSVQPRVFLRYPLDEDIGDFLDLVVGFGLRVAF